MTALGFRSDACRRGHPWTEENTYTDARGHRVCRRCAAGQRAGRRAARRPPAAPPGPLLRPPGWMAAALCAQADPEAWFPAKGDGATARVAKRICRACPVQGDCLEWALSFPERLDGIWGGTTEMERRALRRGRRAA